MTQDKAPEWAIREAEALTGKTTSYSRQVWSIALALSQAYERGQESMRERAARVCEDYEPPAYTDLDDACIDLHVAIRSLPIEQDSEVKG